MPLYLLGQVCPATFGAFFHAGAEQCIRGKGMHQLAKHRVTLIYPRRRPGLESINGYCLVYDPLLQVEKILALGGSHAPDEKRQPTFVVKGAKASKRYLLPRGANLMIEDGDEVGTGVAGQDLQGKHTHQGHHRRSASRGGTV